MGAAAGGLFGDIAFCPVILIQPIFVDMKSLRVLMIGVDYLGHVAKSRLAGKAFSRAERCGPGAIDADGFEVVFAVGQCVQVLEQKNAVHFAGCLDSIL
jgi:hypothetical protein